jgi:HEAT repeat protein
MNPRTCMKLPVLAFPLLVSASLVCLSQARGAASPTAAEVGKVVREAASFQPGQSREPFRRLEEWTAQSVSDASTRKALEAGLVQLLGAGSTFEARRFACKQLGIIGGKEALPALALLLNGDDTAGIACLALTTYPPGKADEILRGAQAKAARSARIQIINTLGDRRDAQSVKLLAQLAGQADRAIAEAALAALGKIGDKSAWNAIAALRKTAGPDLGLTLSEASVRCAAGLAAAGQRKPAIAAYETLLASSQPVYIRRAALTALLCLDKDQGEQRISRVLRGSDSALKPVAIAGVRELRSKRASERFAAEVPRLEPQEQVWMIESLSARGDAAARAAIARSLAAPDGRVRRAAITALGRIGDASSVALLARALANSDDPDQRRAIETALIGLPGGVPTDNAILAELKKSSSGVRVSLIAVYARRQGPAANALLFEEADNADPAVAKAALRALESTAAASDVAAVLRILVGTSDPAVRAQAESTAAQALSKLDDAASRSAVVIEAMRKAQNSETISSVLTLLPRCGDAQSLTVLKAGLTGSNAQIRETAVRALAEWPDMSAWDILLGIYRQGATEALRGIALRGLVRLASEENAHPDARLIERYRQLLADARGEADLRLILGALGSAASPDALQLALPLLENAGVRAEAEVAVKKIAESIKAQHPQAAQEALRKVEAKP